MLKDNFVVVNICFFCNVSHNVVLVSQDTVLQGIHKFFFFFFWVSIQTVILLLSQQATVNIQILYKRITHFYSHYLVCVCTSNVSQSIPLHFVSTLVTLSQIFGFLADFSVRVQNHYPWRYWSRERQKKEYLHFTSQTKYQYRLT